MKEIHDAGKTEIPIDRQTRAKKRKRKFPAAVTGILVALALFSGFRIVQILAEGAKHTAEFQELRELARPAQASSPQGGGAGIQPQEGEEQDKADYAPLYEQNPDYAAWLYIEETGMDYPVMHTPDRPDYYLRRNFDGGYSTYGVPYLAEGCDLESGDNLIVYGHSIRGDKMFGELFGYQKEDYWRSHPVIGLDTRDEKRTYQVIAALHTTVNNPDGDAFPYYAFFDASSPRAYSDYVEMVKSLAVYDTGVSASYGEQLLTLSTCEYDNMETGRFLVVAKLVGSTPLEEGA